MSDTLQSKVKKAGKGFRVTFAHYLMVALLALGMMVVPTAPKASAASGQISGSVRCLYGNNVEVGIWVNVSSGQDGWATMYTNGTSGKSYYYNMSQSSSYRLHVGCSGTPQNWGSVMYTPWVNGQAYSWICAYSTQLGYYCSH